MRIDVVEGYTIRLRDVFNGVLFETDDGEKLGVCMRDGGFEIMIKDTGAKTPNGEEIYTPYSIQGGQIKPMACAATEPIENPDGCEGKEPE